MNNYKYPLYIWAYSIPLLNENTQNLWNTQNTQPLIYINLYILIKDFE